MKKVVSLLAAVGMMSIMAVPVFANTTGTVEVTGGTLQLGTVPTSLSFPGMTLDGLNWQTSAANLSSIRVQDGRGTGEGWNFTVSASQITETGGLGLTFPAGSLVLYAPSSVTPHTDTTSTAPTLGTGTGAIDDTPFTIATAAANTGLGTFDINFPTGAVEIKLAPSVKVIDKVNYPAAPTPYSTTLTWTLNNTP